MKASAIPRMGVIALAIVALVAMVGCEGFFSISFSWEDNPPLARVIDEGGAGIAGLVVALYAPGGTAAVHTAQAGAHVGEYVFPTVTGDGTYELRVSLPATWAGPPYEFYPMPVSITENTVFLGNVVAYYTARAVSGFVKNMRARDVGLAGAEVTLTHYEDADLVYTATSETDGAFAFPYVEPGVYAVSTVMPTAAKAAGKEYGFVPINRLEVTGEPIDNLLIVGFEWDRILDNYAINVITLWSADFDDVDTYLTYPSGDVTGASAPAFTANDLYATGVTGMSAGFVPETGSLANRTGVYYGKPSTASDSSSSFNATTYVNTLNWGTKDFDASLDGTNDTYMVQLDTDATLGAGPETMTIRTIPWMDSATNFSTTGSGIEYLEDLSPSGGYTWIGVMEYYVDAFDSDWSDTTPAEDYLSTGFLPGTTGARSADVVTFVFFTYYEENVAHADLRGVYTVPTYTQIGQASVLRVLCFIGDDGAGGSWDQFVVAPDIRVITDANLKSASVTDDEIPVNGIVSIRGRTK